MVIKIFLSINLDSGAFQQLEPKILAIHSRDLFPLTISSTVSIKYMILWLEIETFGRQFRTGRNRWAKFYSCWLWGGSTLMTFQFEKCATWIEKWPQVIGISAMVSSLFQLCAQQSCFWFFWFFFTATVRIGPAIPLQLNLLFQSNQSHCWKASAFIVEATAQFLLHGSALMTTPFRPQLTDGEMT